MIKKVRLILKEETVEYTKDKITTTTDVVNFMNTNESIGVLAEESAFIICMNVKNEVLAYSEVAKGATSECNIDPKTIFKIALLCNASRLILVHNHPSGDPTPSGVDIKVTSRLQEACKLMSLELLDHVVISGDQYASCVNGINTINKTNIERSW